MRSVNMFVVFLFGLVLITASTGCYYDKAELLYSGTAAVDCATISAKFSTGVKPIMQSKCATAGCHNAAGAAGGAVLETYAQISALSARINQRCVVDKTMPSTGALPATEIAIIKCWVESGAPNN